MPIFISLYLFSVMVIKIGINFINLDRMFPKYFLVYKYIFPIFDFTSCSGHTEISESGIINFFLNPAITFIPPLFFTSIMLNNICHDNIFNKNIVITLYI